MLGTVTDTYMDFGRRGWLGVHYVYQKSGKCPLSAPVNMPGCRCIPNIQCTHIFI